MGVSKRKDFWWGEQYCDALAIDFPAQYSPDGNGQIDGDEVGDAGTIHLVGYSDDFKGGSEVLFETSINALVEDALEYRGSEGFESPHRMKELMLALRDAADRMEKYMSEEQP